MFFTWKQFKGNMAVKIDIRKAFDTLEWCFLLKVLRQFDFSDIFCYVNDIIFHSAKLSAFVNGKSVGYFCCVRGVRQLDPLSLLLFRLAEEVLRSKAICVGECGGSKQVHYTSKVDGSLSAMLNCRDIE
ncbi:ribonuclease H, partial [Trifolium pratense]